MKRLNAYIGIFCTIGLVLTGIEPIIADSDRNSSVYLSLLEVSRLFYTCLPWCLFGLYTCKISLEIVIFPILYSLHALRGYERRLNLDG